MPERSLPPSESPGGGPSGFDDMAGGPDAGSGLDATVSHGVHTESMPVAGLSVGEIRHRHADRFDIDPHSRAELDGRFVDDSTVVRAGQLLVFANHSGEKGACSKLD